MKDVRGENIICTQTQKVCYTRREAGEIINMCKKRHKGQRIRSKSIPQRSYFCTECNCYHTTHYKTALENDHPQKKSELKKRCRTNVA
ncbi:MAG: hypothetical protein ACRC5H_10435 [Treponemataceae bacterium]